MSLNNFKKVKAVATVLVTIACLAPVSAQAQTRPLSLFRFSGDSNTPGIDIRNFQLNTSVLDSDSRPNIGFFEEAAQRFEIRFVSATGEISPTLTPFLFGDLQASQIVSSELERDFGFEITDLILDNDPFTSGFINGGVRYKATFAGSPDVSFTFFIPFPNDDPSTRFNLINNLSALSNLQGFSQVQGVAEARNPSTDKIVREIFGLRFDLRDDFNAAEPLLITEVPEPAATVSLLSIGALGTVSLLKRSRCSS